MTTFDDREKAFEAKFKMDEELKFKVHSRRAKLFGQWVAGKLGLTGADLDAYAKEMVLADFNEAGDEDMIRKAVADLKDKGVSVGDAEIRAHVQSSFEAAKHQLASE